MNKHKKTSYEVVMANMFPKRRINTDMKVINDLERRKFILKDKEFMKLYLEQSR